MAASKEALSQFSALLDRRTEHSKRRARRIAGRPASSLVILAVLAACSVATAEGASISIDGKVHELSTTSFKEAVTGHPWLFVEFYAPWCGHCKKLAPIWDKTAELAKELQVPVAKVDAIAEKKLAEEHDVQGFPTLKLYRGSSKIFSVYQGPREAEKMIEWLRTWLQGPVVESFKDASLTATRAWAEKQTLAVLGVRSGDAKKDEGLREVLESSSFMLNTQKPGSDIPVAEIDAVDGSDLGQLLANGAASPAIVFFRKFDFEENWLTYTIPVGSKWKTEPFMKWVEERRVPALIPASEKTEKYFLQNIDPGNGLVIFFGRDKSYAKILHKLAVAFSSNEKRLKWVQASDPKFAEGLGKSVGLDKDDFPELCIWEFGESEDEDKVFRISQQSENFQVPSKEKFEETVREFVTKWQKGDLKVEKDPVLAVTSDSFEKYVFDKKRDVLVEFYAPWCGHCKALAPEYKKVALHYANDAGVRIVKMDATKHKHSSVDIKSYPTIKLYTRSSKNSPIELEFKSSRNKESLVEFVEEHRGRKLGSGKKSQKKKEDKQVKAQQQPLKEKTFATKQGLDGASSSGVWVFDDSMQPESRGQVLSKDMVASRGGYTFVQVGSIGVLISGGSPAIARAVRRFESLELATQHFQGSVATKPPKAGSLSCPKEPANEPCAAWCAGVAPLGVALSTALTGKPCNSKNDKTVDHPGCACYDEGYTLLYAMCVSPCPKATVAPSPSKGKKSTPAISGTCSNGDASCATDLASAAQADAAELEGQALPRMRYLLYDTKYGEGFNLQREIYPRTGWLVAKLNQELQERCGSKVTGTCARWTLVLPPWCRVVHWWSGPELVPWSELFEKKALMGSQVPVMEFEEYRKLSGGNTVDLAVVYIVDEITGTTDGKGEFRGWAKEASDCASKHQSLPQHEFLDASKTAVKIVYAGHCDNGIIAKHMRCAGFKSPWPQATLDMLSTLDSSVSSVFLKSYDYLLAPDNKELDDLGLRESMLFKEEIRKQAEDFVASKIGGPYISAHCRRTDFIRVRSKTTPGADSVAEKLNAVIAARGIDKVFIATDAPDDLRADLKKQVKGEVFFFEDAHVSFNHPGKQAAAEMWIAARSEFFIGTQESRFTMHIQLERGFLGKAKETSEQEFCKTYEKTGKPCLAPAYRHPARKGAHREAYF